MNFCLCRDSNHCKDYPVEYGCLFLGEAVLGINPALGHRVTKAEALEHARRCPGGRAGAPGGARQVGYGLARGESGGKAAHHLQLLPVLLLVEDPAGGRPEHRRQGDENAGGQGGGWRAVPGVWDLHAGCLLCRGNPAGGWAGGSPADSRAEIGEECRGCGRCVEICPNGAIEITIEQGMYIQGTIERIAPLVELG